MSGRTLISTWGIAATDLLSSGDHFDVQKDEGICTDTPPCLTQLLCDKLLTFAKGSEDKCGDINRGTLMVYEEHNVLRAGTVTLHFKIINFQSFSITFSHTCARAHTHTHTHTHTNTIFSSVQSLRRVQLFAIPLTAACQASLSITNSRS